MKKEVNDNELAFPMYNELGNLHATGLTRRELFAAMAMQGITVMEHKQFGRCDPRETAKLAVDHADALIAALKNTED